MIDPKPAPVDDEVDAARAAILRLTQRPDADQIIRTDEEAPNYQGAEWLQELDDGRWQMCSISERAKGDEEPKRGAILSPTSGALDDWFWKVSNGKGERFPNLVVVARQQHPDFVQPEDPDWSPEQHGTILAQAMEMLEIDAPYLVLEAGEDVPDDVDGYVVQKHGDQDGDFTVSLASAGAISLLWRIEYPGPADRFGRSQAFKAMLSYMMNRPSFRDRV